MYTIKINGQIVSVNKYKTTVAKSVKVSKVAFNFDESWNDLSIFACFRNANIGQEYTVQMTKPYEVDIPWEVLQVAGKLEVGALGLNEGGIVKPTIWCTISDIVNGVSTDGIDSAEPTPEIVVQITETADRAMDVANDAYRIATEVKNKADAGLFDGRDGVDGYTPQKGVDYFDGKDGENGQDGISPTVSVEEIDGGHRMTVVDSDGNKSFIVANGRDGADGQDGKDGYTPQKGIDYFDGKDGIDGKDGANGKDGYTPIKGVDYADGKDGKDGSDGVSATHSWDGTVLTVTSASGTSSVDLKGDKGERGDKGKDGHTPIKGEDYFTEADKQEIAEQASKLVDIPSIDGLATEEYVNEAIENIDIPETVTSWNDLTDKPFGETFEFKNTIYTKMGGFTFSKLTDGRWYGIASNTGLALVVGRTYRISIKHMGMSTLGEFEGIATNNQTTMKYQIIDGKGNMLGHDALSTTITFNSSNAISSSSMTQVVIYEASEVTVPLDDKYIPDTIARKTDIPEVPTNVSQLTNDAGYITADQIQEMIDNAISNIPIYNGEVIEQ